MKKLRLVSIFIFLSFLGFSQTEPDEYSYKNRIFVNMGTSFYEYHYLTTHDDATQAIEGSFEYGIHKNVTMGASYAQQTRNHSFEDEVNYSPPQTFYYAYDYKVIRFRIVSYLNDFLSRKNILKLDDKKWKIYTSYMVGITLASERLGWEQGAIINTTNASWYHDVTYHFGMTLGVRSNPIGLLGLFAEVGPAELGLVKVGATIDIK